MNYSYGFFCDPLVLYNAVLNTSFREIYSPKAM